MNTVSDKCGTMYEKALTCHVKDGQTLLAFYDSPGQHQYQLRTGKPVRHPHVRAKEALSRKAAKLTVFKPDQVASPKFPSSSPTNVLD